MQNWVRVCGLWTLWLAAGCAQEPVEGGAEDRIRSSRQPDSQGSPEGEETVSDWSDDFDLDDGPCAGQINCAWWSGRLQIEGAWLELDELRPIVEVSHCSERTKNTVMIGLAIPTERTGGTVERDLVRISASPKYVRLGESLDSQPGEKKSPWKALAHVSLDGLSPSAQRPISGTILFRALEEEEPLDMIYELNFGEFGAVEGRIKAAGTQARVCELSGGPEPRGRPQRP